MELQGVGGGGERTMFIPKCFFFFEASSICILRSTILIKIHGFVIFMYTYCTHIDDGNAGTIVGYPHMCLNIEPYH